MTLPLLVLLLLLAAEPVAVALGVAVTVLPEVAFDVAFESDVAVEPVADVDELVGDPELPVSLAVFEVPASVAAAAWWAKNPRLATLVTSVAPTIPRRRRFIPAAVGWPTGPGACGLVMRSTMPRRAERPLPEACPLPVDWIATICPRVQCHLGVCT